MFYVVDKTNRNFYQQQIEQMHRCRKEVFIDERGWELPETNGLETDQYDKPDTDYALCLNENDEVIAGMRYVPMTGPNMVEEIFSEHINRPYKKTNAVEATRGFIKPGIRSSGLWGIGLCAKFEYLLWKQAEVLIETIDIALLPALLEVGWEIDLISKPFTDGNSTYICISTKVDMAALELPRRKFGIDQPVLFRVSEDKITTACLAA